MKKNFLIFLMGLNIMNINTLSLNHLLIPLSNEYENNLSAVIKNYFENTTIASFNLEDTKNQMKEIIIQIIKKTAPKDYKNYAITNLVVDQDLNDINKTILSLKIMKNSSLFLNEQYDVHLKNLINCKKVNGNIVYIQQINEQNSDLIEILAISEKDEEYQINLLKFSPDDLSNDDIIQFTSKQFVAPFFDPIFSFVEHRLVNSEDEKISLQIFNENKNVKYELNLTSTSISFNEPLIEDIEISQSDLSQIYLNYKKKTIIYSGNDLNDTNKIKLIKNDNFMMSDNKFEEIPITMGDIIGNCNIVLDDDYGLILGINSKHEWIANKLNLQTNVIENNIELLSLNNLLIDKIIHWDEQSNTLSYIISTNRGKRLEIINLNSNKVLFKSPIINYYFLGQNNIDTIIGQFDYSQETKTTILGTKKQILTRENNIIDLNLTNDNGYMINTKNFAFIKNNN